MKLKVHTHRCWTRFSIYHMSPGKQISNILCLCQIQPISVPVSFKTQKVADSTKILKSKLMIQIRNNLIYKMLILTSDENIIYINQQQYQFAMFSAQKQ